MSLGALTTALKPPADPREARRRAAWDDVETRVGTRLPSDYKGFIEKYGSGSIDEFLVVLNPFAANTNINLLDCGRRRSQAHAELRGQFPELYVHDVYPAPGGLLPFAITDSGNVFYWKTTGEPNSWSVVAFEGRGPDFYEFAGGMTDFLAALLTRAIVVDVLPDDFPSDAVTFRPYDV